MLNLGNDRNEPRVWQSELLVAAEQAAGIPLLGHLGVSSNHSAKRYSLHRSHLAEETRCSPSFRKNHNGSRADSKITQILDNFRHFIAQEDSKNGGDPSDQPRLLTGITRFRFGFQCADWVSERNLDLRITSHFRTCTKLLASRTLRVRRSKLQQLSQSVLSQHLQLPTAEVPIYNPE